LVADTAAQGLEANLVDVGRGTETDFRACAEPEFPAISSSSGTNTHFPRDSNHRRVKYGHSREYGAAGFVIVNNIPGDMLVTGSCGQDSRTNIPAVGVSLETGAALTAANAGAGALTNCHHRRAATSVNLIAEIAGQHVRMGRALCTL